MAKITPSALITAIQGKWHGSCFQMWKGAIVVRRSPRPRKITSESRFNFRGTVSSISGCFYSMTADQRISWRCYALLLPTSVTGYNAFMARGVALEIACHSDLCIYFDAPGAYAPPMSPAPISLCYHPSNARYCVMWTNPNCSSVYVQGMLSVQAMFSNEKSPKWRIFDTVPSTDLHMIFDASAFPADQMIRFTARSINMRGELSIKAEAKPPPPLPESVTLLYPIGGETLYTGSSCLIEWRSKSIDNVKLEYSTNNGADWNLITVSVSAYLGQYAWTIPAVESTNYKVKITNTDDPTIYDESDSVFTVITKPWVTLLAPNGSEEWAETSKQNITWSHNNAVNVILKYSTDNGLNYTTITASTPAVDETYEWTVPSGLSTTCLVKILVHENQTIFDVSDNTFSIIEHTVISNISFTSPHTFRNAVTSWLDICFLSSNIFIIPFRDSSDNGYGKSVVGSVSNKVFTFGDPFTFCSLSSVIRKVYRLNNSQFAVIYRTGDGVLNYTTRCIVGTIDGYNISFGSPDSSPGEKTYSSAGVGLSPSRCVALWRDTSAGNYARSVAYSISDSVVAHGSISNLNSSQSYEITAFRRNDTQFICAYQDRDNSYHGTLQLGTLDNLSLSYGNKFIFNSAATCNFSGAFYDDNHFVIIYYNSSYLFDSHARIGTIDGSNITFGDPSTLSTSEFFYPNCAKVDSETVLASYTVPDIKGAVKIITTTGHAISISDEFPFFNNKSNFNRLAIQSSTQFLLAFTDPNGDNLGRIVVGYDS